MDIVVFATVVLAVTQVIKTAFNTSKKFVPLVAIITGALFYILAVVTGSTTFGYETVLSALISILTAMGFYSGVKATSGR